MIESTEQNAAEEQAMKNPNESQNNVSTGYLEHLEEIGVVSKAIYPDKHGQIYYQGSWWRALCTHDVLLPVDSTVRVIGMKTITCIVEPFPMTN